MFPFLILNSSFFPNATSLLLMGFVSGCNPAAPLPGGYTVSRASSHEVGLSGGKYNSIVAGPELTRLGRSGTIIFGEIAAIPGRPPL